MRSRTTLALRVAAVSALACAPDFAPRSVIENLRVLALVATPLELYPGQPSITLSARTVLKTGLPPAAPGDVAQQWSFCPFSLGSSVGYACVAPACETLLGNTRDVTLTSADLATRLQGCYDALGAAGGLPPSVPPDPAAVGKLDLVFRYVAISDPGQPEAVRREAVQIVPLYRAAPAVPNAAPTIQEVRVCGQSVAATDFVPTLNVVDAPPGCALAPGADVEVEVSLRADSAQPYTDAAGSHTEAPVVSFYTTKGRFNFDRANGPSAKVTLKHEKVSSGGTAYLHAVARDLRGGQTVVGPIRLPVAPP